MCALMVFLLGYTSLIKLLSTDYFQNTMAQNSLLAPHSDWLAWVIPLTELAIVILLVIPRTRRSGLLACTLIMFLFTGYVGYMLLMKSSLPCTCGGVLQSMSWKQHFHFNLLFTLLSLIAYIFYPQDIGTNRSCRTPVNIVGNNLKCLL